VSAPGSGTDVQKTINTNSFTLTTAVAVPSVVTTATPIFTFYSPQDGTITYGGDCVSPVLSAISGNNSVTFNALPNGTHSNCTITVTDGGGYASNVLAVPSFTVTGSSVTSLPTTTISTTNTTGIYAYKFVNFLGVGSTGIDVTELQQRLTVEGVYSGAISGYYGPLTKAAVMKYQGLHGIDQFGYVGPGTRAMLNSGV
jgi:hypothetical protein